MSEWIFTGTRADGIRLEVNGCDVFTFRDGRIAVKNSYRKTHPPISRPTRKAAGPYDFMTPNPVYGPLQKHNKKLISVDGKRK